MCRIHGWERLRHCILRDPQHILHEIVTEGTISAQPMQTIHPRIGLMVWRERSHIQATGDPMPITWA